MGFVSKVQVIQRGEKNRQFYFICPAPLAQALEIEKGEEIEWVVVNKQELTIRRVGKLQTQTSKTERNRADTPHQSHKPRKTKHAR